ncbi:hypothetical protein KUCAC02_032816 [Chaenocephalus aceratus]|nr:hypothetical protein KUCAC02_032816 [Chaenocephalus aceratus]
MASQLFNNVKIHFRFLRPPSQDEARPKENTEPVLRGSIEAAVKLPVGTKSSGLNNEEDGVPVVAFKERRSLRTLSGLEEIQTHQRAEVI